MINLKLEYISNNPWAILKNIALPLQFKEDCVFKLHPTCASIITDDIEHLDVNIILHLALHHFYSSNIEAYERICTFIYYTKADLTKQKDHLSILFRKVTILPCEIIPQMTPVYQVKIQGISKEGIILLYDLKQKKILPQFILDLYINKTYAHDFHTDTLYRILKTNTEASCCVQNYGELNFLLNNNLLNNLDVSSLSLEQCATHPIIRYIVNQKQNTYIYIGKLRGQNDLYEKRLYWL